MAINIFEGARRIVKIVTVLVLVIGGIAALTDSPFVSLTYNLNPIKGVVALSDVECPQDAVSASRFVKTQEGKSIFLTLCLLSLSLDNGQKIVPYKESDGSIKADFAGTDSAQKYVSRMADSFALPASDAEAVRRIWWSKRLSNLLEGALMMFLGLGIFWAAVWATGWIVRGFLGIPRGMDRRP